ncbi:rRNA pseudouridine synthase [bacterium]|nr:rRNA pseudouridine synthase [bacterium]
MPLIKINKYIAQATRFSRREADNLIEKGKVIVNDELASLGMRIDPEKDKVYVNNELVTQSDKEIFIILNKPTGYIVTRSDPKRRKTVYEIVKLKEKVVTAGRLDYNTSGVLLLSNSGEMIHRLTHPRFEIKRVYMAKVHGKFNDKEIQALKDGFYLDGKKLAPIVIKKISEWKNGEIVYITLREGRYREIRRICRVFKHWVKDLHRVSYAGLDVDGLKIGEWRYLSKDEISYLKKKVGLSNEG